MLNTWEKNVVIPYGRQNFGVDTKVKKEDELSNFNLMCS